MKLQNQTLVVGWKKLINSHKGKIKKYERRGGRDNVARVRLFTDLLKYARIHLKEELLKNKQMELELK